MNQAQPLEISTASAAHGYSPQPADTAEAVMKVLLGIRALQSNGSPYGPHTNLSDAGFTSIEMVKVMLGVEAAFDVMIPQEQITPENFLSAAAIAAMIRQMTNQA